MIAESNPTAAFMRPSIRPLMNTVQLLIFLLDDRPYGLRLAQVDRVIRAAEYAPLPEAPELVLGAIDLEGDVLPLLDIRARFGLPTRALRIEDQFVIAHTRRRTVAIAVDSVKSVTERDQSEIVAAKNILPRLEQIEGAVQLEDGLTLIHDLDRFLSIDQERQLDEALAGEASHV
jgi:purine-binding chemotaxis protein CheW